MKKKGFTIVELLAAIALLAVILVIATVSISSVSKAIRQKQKENLLLDIKVVARKYIANTGLSKVYVQTLIEEGYMTTDSDDKVIRDPVTNESLNCYYFSVENDEEKFLAGDCQLDSLSDVALSIVYCNESGCTPDKAIPSNWVNYSPIYLGVKSNISLAADAKYTWITPLSPDLVDSSKNHLVQMPTAGYINDVYEVVVTSDNKEYRANARLKVDIIPPTVSDITITDENVYTQSKDINAVISDSESGLSAFAVTMSASMPSSDKWTSINEKRRNITQVINENGTYYIWVKDAAGNVSTSSQITVTKIDTTPPECTLSGENTDWKSGDVNIIWGCNDTAAGCNPAYSGGETKFTETAQTGVINSYTIKDNAGNQTQCPAKNVNLYIDKTAPEVSKFTITSKESKYNSKDVILNAEFSDIHSGTKGICLSETNNSSNCIWQSNTTNIYSGENTFAADSYDGRTLDLYLFVKDNVGNISKGKKTSYIIYTLCSAKKVDYYGNYGSCITTNGCGDGTKYRNVYYKDSYFESSCGVVKNGDYTSCYAGDCAVSKEKTYYVACNSYYITTCSNGVCNYTKKNEVSQVGVINENTLSENLESSCTEPSCGAYINSSKSGSVVTFYTNSNCTRESYSSGGCTDKGTYGTTGFKIDFSGKSSCSPSMKRYAYATWGEKYTYNSSWTTRYCNGTSERNGCYCTGDSVNAACKNRNTACAC